MCRKQAGTAVGRLCDKCDGKCPVCDSYVRPTTMVRICDECSFGNYMNKCVVCGGEGISDAFYCFECTRLEKDRDGCPKIINLGSSRTDVSILSIPSGWHRSRSFLELAANMCLRNSYSTKRKRIGRRITSDSVAWVGLFRSVERKRNIGGEQGVRRGNGVQWSQRLCLGFVGKEDFFFSLSRLKAMNVFLCRQRVLQ